MSGNLELQNWYQLHPACWQHSQQCRASQTSAPLRSCNCSLFQNYRSKETNWEQNNCINVTNLQGELCDQQQKETKRFCKVSWGACSRAVSCLDMAATVNDLSSSAMLKPRPINRSAWYNFASSVSDSSAWVGVKGQGWSACRGITCIHKNKNTLASSNRPGWFYWDCNFTLNSNKLCFHLLWLEHTHV